MLHQVNHLKGGGTTRSMARSCRVGPLGQGRKPKTPPVPPILSVSCTRASVCAPLPPLTVHFELGVERVLLTGGEQLTWVNDSLILDSHEEAGCLSSGLGVEHITQPRRLSP